MPSTKPFSEILVSQAFRFDGQTFTKLAPQYAPNDPSVQYNAVGVFNGEAWLFDETDTVEVI